MGTLLLSRSEVEALLDPIKLLPALHAAFVAYSADPTERALRVRSPLPGPGTTTVLFPGVVRSLPVYSVKVHAKFPNERPAIRGVLCLHAAATGDLLAVMDSTYLTAVRTGLAGAMAADVLSRSDADTATVVGGGVQGQYQLRFLAAMRPLKRAWVYDVEPERADAFARTMTEDLGFPVEPMRSVRSAIGATCIVLAATWAREPFILPGMLAPGTHITTLGPDEPGKAEVAADVIRSALFVCDDRKLAVEMGALGGVGLGPDAVAVELGDVLAGRHPGREAKEQVTVYGGVGLAFQDVVAAWAVYEAARTRGLGREMDFVG